MEYFKYLILGAGPAGLTFAAKLKKCGVESFLVLEKEKVAGGLCRSENVDGSPIDIGGGHFLDVRRPAVDDFLFRFMPRSEWELFDRNSLIQMKDSYIGHPFEANIWQMDLEDQVAYLSSIAKAGCNCGVPMPERFVDWIRWKLGNKVAEDYMLPYNRKMFADELDGLGTYWMEKLPNVSFEETLLSCLTHKPHGTQPGHAQFYYPKKYGYGEVWLRMADSLAEHLRCESVVDVLDCDSKTIRLTTGEQFRADCIITTIPWIEFKEISGMPKDIRDSIGELRHSSVEVRYVSNHLETDAHWIYVPDSDIPYHRILVRHNFCNGSRGYWLETRQERTADYKENDSFHYLNQYAYPLNTIGKPAVMNKLLAFAESRGIYGLGRWGEHCHYNSDVVVERAMELAEKAALQLSTCHLG